MKKTSALMLRRLLEAAEILHAHARGPFHVRLFRAVDVLYEDVHHGFEVYGLKDGSHTIESDVPFPEKDREELLRRTGELVPLEHPLFPCLLKGDTTAQRLSDLTSQRQFQRTALFNEIFKAANARHQLAIPFASPQYAGGLTINRSDRDFTDQDLEAARLFAGHVMIAYQSGELLHSTAAASRTARRIDFAPLRRRGLTKRECEVLWWVSQGKRDSEIAIILGMSPRTASGHVRAILRKLGTETRTAAAAIAFAER